MLLDQSPLIVEYEPHTLRATLTKIERLIEKDSRNPKMIRHTRQLLSHVPDRRLLSVADAEMLATKVIWDWICRNVAFVKDPIDPRTGKPEEVLADCEAILSIGAADCDEHVILCATMLAIVGIRTERWIGGVNRPQHVWNVAYPVGSQGVNVDTTLKRLPFGTRPGNSTWSYWRCKGG